MNTPGPAPFCRILLLFAAGLAQTVTAAQAQPNETWRAGSGSMTLEIRGDYLPDFGIEIFHEGRPITGRERLHFQLDPVEPIGVKAPLGIFQSLIPGSGRLMAETRLAIRRGERVVDIDRLRIMAGEREGRPLIIGLDEKGHRLLTMSHIHMAVRPETGLLSAANAEVEASAHLAGLLDMPELSGMPIGTGWLELALTVPDGAATTGTPPGCEQRPIWPQEGTHEADVALIDMGSVVYQGTRRDGHIKIAPSATLKNVSQADIPWIGQFDSLAEFPYPYSPADQHPFLVWNLYRIADGRIEMLAASGAKHAFFSTNVNCGSTSCGSNHVLWPQCEDTYSTGNNDTSTYQGPRDEIVASLGQWDNCGSFFDPGCTGNQTDYAGQWRHRLLVDPGELQQPGAEYFVDAWYVIQYDIDIWNSMGYRPVAPSPSGAGWNMNPGVFSEGEPAISEWVAEDESDPMAAHTLITIDSETPDDPYPGNMPQGHLRLLVKVSEVEPGRYRYNYALQNYDFDRGLEKFRISIPAGSTVFDTFFNDIDSDADNDWDVVIGDDHVLFQAPTGNPLKWFSLFNFEIETDAAPVDSVVWLDLCGSQPPGDQQVETLGPASGIDLLFSDSFGESEC